MRIMKEHIRCVHITSHDVDTKLELKISSLLAMCQESSEQQLAEFGLDHAELKKRDLAFLLARVFIQYHRIPLEGEDVTISVCPRGAQGAQYFREFHISKGDELLVEVMESWILVELSTRKIRPPSIMEDLEIDIESHRGKWMGRLSRLKMPKEMPLLSQRKIHYSDLDFNGHVSNIHYGRFLLDALPSYANFDPDPEKKMEPPRSYQKIWINYIGETKWGDTLQIYGQEDADGFSLYAENAHGRSIECQGK